MKKKTDWWIYLVCVILFCVIGVCSYKISYKLIDYYQSAANYKELADKYATIKTEPAVKTPVPTKEPEKEQEETKEEPLPDALKDDGTFPIEINFDELKEKNSDVIGWIYLPGTKLNYPIVRGEDNDFYLHQTIEKTYSFGGTIFLDVNCARDWSSRHNIIYGHNMNDGSMFRPIIRYKEQDYYDKNPFMYLSTPDGNYRLDIFAGFITESESEVYSTFFTSGESFAKWAEKMAEKSSITTDLIPSENSKIITLSTCTYERQDMRYVLMAIMRPVTDNAEELLAAPPADADKK